MRTGKRPCALKREGNLFMSTRPERSSSLPNRSAPRRLRAAIVASPDKPAAGEALGIIETRTVAAIIDAADAGVKGAHVRLLELRLADGLGGKAYLLFGGAVADVEAAVELGRARIGAPGRAISRVIPQLHGEMRENLAADARFRSRIAAREEG